MSIPIRIRSRVRARSRPFGAAIQRAGFSIVAIDEQASLTSTAPAGLGTIAKYPVIAVGVGPAGLCLRGRGC